jgi:mannosyltransferase OCH1-like enzyme
MTIGAQRTSLDSGAALESASLHSGPASRGGLRSREASSSMSDFIAPSETTIPPRLVTPIFHQTWRNRHLATHSRYALMSRRSVEALHPGFRHILWIDHEIDGFIDGYVRAQLPAMYEIYQRLPKKIMKIDFVRYLWMYVFGGVYADLDLVFQRSMAGLLQPDKSVFFLARAWTTGGKHFTTSVHQAWLASAPQHPLWLDVMTFIGRRLDAGEASVLDLTGPNGVSHAISELSLCEKYPDVAILPAEYIFQPGRTTTDRALAYCTHLTTQTWTRHRLLLPLRFVVNHLRAGRPLP